LNCLEEDFLEVDKKFLISIFQINFHRTPQKEKPKPSKRIRNQKPKTPAVMSSQKSGCLGRYCGHNWEEMAAKNGKPTPCFAFIDNEQRSYEISRRLIVQADKERNLVDLFLKRICTGEEGEYVTHKNANELVQYPVGGMYDKVEVCATCYQIYCAVEQARKKSMKKLERKKRNKKRMRQVRKCCLLIHLPTILFQ
jgi:hypothetical protein